MDIALIVKSRRAASSTQSVVQATSAWRPSVTTSRRRLVTSMGVRAITAVSVPCARPVSKTRKPAAARRRAISSGGKGAAMSRS